LSNGLGALERTDIMDIRYMHPVCIGSTHISKDTGAMHLGLAKPLSRATSNI
jgi:hypothetical protein